MTGQSSSIGYGSPDRSRGYGFPYELDVCGPIHSGDHKKS